MKEHKKTEVQSDAFISYALGLGYDVNSTDGVISVSKYCMHAEVVEYAPGRFIIGSRPLKNGRINVVLLSLIQFNPKRFSVGCY